jgi:hypothetical protein
VKSIEFGRVQGARFEKRRDKALPPATEAIVSGR